MKAIGSGQTGILFRRSRTLRNAMSENATLDLVRREVLVDWGNRWVLSMKSPRLHQKIKSHGIQEALCV